VFLDEADRQVLAGANDNTEEIRQALLEADRQVLAGVNDNTEEIGQALLEADRQALTGVNRKVGRLSPFSPLDFLR
jgi:ABC-type sugar transport system substrate-binding protein